MVGGNNGLSKLLSGHVLAKDWERKNKKTSG